MCKQLLSLGLILVAGSAFAEDGVPSFKLEPVQVEATELPGLKELDPVGAAGQPAWVAGGTPRFTFSDTYVMAAGKKVVGVSAATDFGFDSHTRTEVAEYAAVGLKGGWQVGAAFLQDHNSQDDETNLGGKLEVRKALAPWGRIWGNPTLSLSFAEREGDNDTVRGAVLLTGSFRERWSWTLNGSYAHTFADVRQENVQITGGAMYSLKDNKLAVGAEAVAQWQQFRVNGWREDGVALYVGPSVQWRPTVAGRTINVNAAFLPLGVRGNDFVFQNRFAVGVSYGF